MAEHTQNIYASADEMERLDKEAVAQGLEIRQMMELAGYHVIEVLRRLQCERTRRIVVVAGKGNKGGDGLAAVRHMVNHGWEHVSVVLATAEDELTTDTSHQLALLEAMDIEIVNAEAAPESAAQKISNADVAIDALIGYHLNGAPRGYVADLINAVNTARNTCIAYDVPSGVDATSGECLTPCISADATITLALPKHVFATENGLSVSGRIFLADIGIPAYMYRRATSYERPSFGSGVQELTDDA